MRSSVRRRQGNAVALAGALALGSFAIAGLLLVAPRAVAASRPSERIVAVGAENEYANVISQIGGRYVAVSAIMSNPNTDPHTFEASPKVAQVVSAARLVVQNGLGYDSFMDKIESASPSRGRKVIVVQKLLGLPDTTPNPHLWYSPKTMPALARAVASALSAIVPSRRAYFRRNLATFDHSLEGVDRAIAALERRHHGAPVATTEPVADYLLQAAGLVDKTPFSLQADVMNGIDPSPQSVTFEQQLFSRHAVKVFVYNRQVTDTLTDSFLALARSNDIPVVGVYETMPTGYRYQSWMLAEVRAIERALSARKSTTGL